ncbi:MAG: hypothetical protein WBX77_16065 [Pseudolabrys sp.]
MAFAESILVSDRQRLIDGLRELMCNADDVRPNAHVVVADEIAARLEQLPISTHVAHDRLILVRRIDMNQTCADIQARKNDRCVFVALR